MGKLDEKYKIKNEDFTGIGLEIEDYILKNEIIENNRKNKPIEEIRLKEEKNLKKISQIQF